MKLTHHILKTLTVIISLIVYLGSFPGLGNTATICFSDNGHVAIESTVTSSLLFQNTTVIDHLLKTEEHDHCTDHCNSCFNIPLSFTTANLNNCKNKDVLKLERNFLQKADTEILQFFTALITSSPPLKKPLIIDNTITSLRTIVLLV